MIKFNLWVTLRNILLSRNSDWRGQFLRASITGFFAFIVDYSFLFIITEYFKVYYLISQIISFFISLVLVYLFSIKWIFEKRRFKNMTVEVFIFFLLELIELGIIEFCIWSFTEWANFHYLLSKIAASIIAFTLVFILKKTVLFK